MDDILPFAKSEEEMLQRLHRLFTRFREYNESEQALAHEAEAIELIAAFLASQEIVEYVAPTVEWAATEVDMDVDVPQKQLQRIPAGPQNLTAETFELIQRAHNYVVGITACNARWRSFAGRAFASKV
jgi:hypothetical protein